MSRVPPPARRGRGQHSRCRSSLLPVRRSFNKAATIKFRAKQLVHATCCLPQVYCRTAATERELFCCNVCCRTGQRSKVRGYRGWKIQNHTHARAHTHSHSPASRCEQIARLNVMNRITSRGDLLLFLSSQLGTDSGTASEATPSCGGFRRCGSLQSWTSLYFMQRR